MEIKMFKKEARISPNAYLGIRAASLLGVGVIGGQVSVELNERAAERMDEQFGDILGKGHPRKKELVDIATKEVSNARLEGRIQLLAEKITADVLTAMGMSMLRRN